MVEFYAHRPIRGVLTIAGVAVASGMAAKTRTVGARTERPYLVAGIVTASGIAAVSALNATLHVLSPMDGGTRVGLSFVPTASGLAARVTVPSRW